MGQLYLYLHPVGPGGLEPAVGVDRLLDVGRVGAHQVQHRRLEGVAAPVVYPFLISVNLNCLIF